MAQRARAGVAKVRGCDAHRVGQRLLDAVLQVFLGDELAPGKLIVNMPEARHALLSRLFVPLLQGMQHHAHRGARWRRSHAENAALAQQGRAGPAAGVQGPYGTESCIEPRAASKALRRPRGRKAQAAQQIHAQAQTLEMRPGSGPTGENGCSERLPCLPCRRRAGANRFGVDFFIKPYIIASHPTKFSNNGSNISYMGRLKVPRVGQAPHTRATRRDGEETPLQ